MIDDYGRLVTMVFLKGYQWPIDIRANARTHGLHVREPSLDDVRLAVCL